MAMTSDTYPPVYALAVSNLATLKLRRGMLEQAEALLAPIEAEPVAALSLAACKLVRGETPRAGALLQRALRAYSEKSIESLRALGMLVEVHHACQDMVAAEATLRRLREAGAGKTWPEARALAGLAAGRIASDRGDTEAALREFDVAAKCFSQLRMPWEAARVRYEIARTCAESNPELAIVEAQGALRTFESLGAHLDADRASALLRLLGVASKPGPRGLSLLTERESEVLELLRLGLSNPEIAERLVISRKTAAHHVSSLLAKLGVRNRSEAVAYASTTAARN